MAREIVAFFAKHRMEKKIRVVKELTDAIDALILARIHEYHENQRILNFHDAERYAEKARSDLETVLKNIFRTR